MEAPPPALGGLHVIKYAKVDESVVFEQRRTLSVDGQWLGRVACLVICQDFDTLEYAIQHCTLDWEPLGIAGAYASIEQAEAAIERSYHGISAKWIPADTSFEEARAINEAELRDTACSFCGRTILQTETMIGDAVRICARCIDRFHAVIRAARGQADMKFDWAPPPTLEQLRRGRQSSILFECIAGSRAYGTSNAASDEDVRGIFAVPATSYMDLVRPPDQVSDDRGNVVYYSLRRIVELLSEANPNILELLFMPEDCVLSIAPEMQLLIADRHLFVSKQCADTHAGYAMSQIRKAKGQNKWVNNPRPEAPPEKEDYCYIVPWSAEQALVEQAPARPIPLKEIGWSLNEFNAARLEHGRDTYRLYRYGKDARGVFRGGMLACESIPKEDERTHFAGFLLYSEQAWKQALLEHQNYWAWRRDRNEARWQQQERGELDFDAKNMMHTVRLLLSGRSIMQTGAPIVRFSGEPLALLMSIREGRQSFEEIMELAESLLADCERLRSAADLPDTCDTASATRLLRKLTHEWELRCP